MIGFSWVVFFCVVGLDVVVFDFRLDIVDGFVSFWDGVCLVLNVLGLG